ncbi:MAG: AsmA-like C-terminal region-containing protein [Hyphomicrobiaceae bacterium]
MLGIALLAILPLGLFGIALVYVKLLFGAIPLQFIVSPLQHSLAEGLDADRATIGQALLQRSETGGLEFKLGDISVGLGEGRQTLAAEGAVIRFDLSTMLSGQISPSHIVLQKPVLSLNTSTGAEGGKFRHGAILRNSSLDGLDKSALDRAEKDADAAASAAKTPTDAVSELVNQAMLALDHVRKGGSGVGQLRSVAMTGATVEMTHDGHLSTWNVPVAEFVLDRSSSTNIGAIRAQGQLLVDQQLCPFELNLVGRNGGQAATLVASIGNIVPNRLADKIPSIHAFEAIDAPLTLRTELDMQQGGAVQAASFDIDVSGGRLLIASLGNLPLVIQGGKLSLVWDAVSQSLRMAPSPIQLDGGYIKLAGRLVPFQSRGGRKGFELDLWAPEGALGNERGMPPLLVEQLKLNSRIWRDGGATELQAFALKVGGVEITAHGAIGSRLDGSSMRLAGRVGSMSAQRLKSAWPTGLAPQLRRSIISRLVAGEIKGGEFGLSRTGEGASASDRLTLTLEGSDLAFQIAEGVPPLQIPRTLLRAKDDALEVSAAEAHIVSAGGKKLNFKDLRIAVPNLRQERKVLEFSGHGQGAAAVVAAIAASPGIAVLKRNQLPAGTDGKVDALWRVSVPISEQIAPQDVSIDSKIRITDGRVPDAFGSHDIKGATFTVAASEKRIDLKGEMLLAGVLAEVSGQWLIGEHVERQPPLRIKTRLDTADRRQLGLELDDLVRGEVPIEVLVSPGKAGEPKVQVNADLTGAELRLDGISWTKPAGRAAKLGFEVAKRQSAKGIELRDFKISGDSLTIDGTVLLGPDNKAQAYSFPGFSLNVVTNLQVEGKRRSGRIWDVKARGKTFDATEMIRELYALNNAAPAKKRRGTEQKGIELDLAVDTILGLNDTSLRHVRVNLSERDDELISATMTGALDGGGRINITLPRRADGQRVAMIETDNAGQALKLAGIYTSMKGGRGTLALDLDGKGAAERTGQLHVRKCKIIGDPVFYEVLQNADEGRPAIAAGSPRPRRQVVREEIVFDDVRAVFAAGNGQIAVQSLAATGPLVGVSVRGKVDFRSQRLSLGGTYIPLSGLNRALSGIPLVREIFTGPKGDGIFGITFGVNGKMSQPQVIVNPFSFVAPGVLREIFQMVPENPQVTPGQPGRRGGGRTGARSNQQWPYPATPPYPSPTTNVIDGWSLKTDSKQ